MKINIKTFMCKKLCGCHPNNVCVVFVVSVIKVCVCGLYPYTRLIIKSSEEKVHFAKYSFVF